MSEMKFKNGTIKLDGRRCGKVTDFRIVVNNNINEITMETDKKYSFSITMKLPLKDRIRRFFKRKTEFERLLENTK